MSNFYFVESELGLTLKTDQVICFFGKKPATLEKIKSQFSELSFQRIKQTHSDIILESSDQVYEADAHYTSKRNNALLISTADCLPALVHCKQTNRVASIHAGWMGVANQILLKTLQKLIQTGSSEKRFKIWIGPHIQQESFEIDLDVLKQLEFSSHKLTRADYAYEKNNKFYVDLNKIAVSQIDTALNTSFDFINTSKDTKTDSNYWSFRRDKELAGRNLSFIALI